MKNIKVSKKWLYLPIVFSSVAILATQVSATPNASQQYQDAKQVSQINHNYVGGRTQIGVGVTDKGHASFDVNQVLSESTNSSTSGGLWGEFDLKGDDKGLQGRGVQLNHNWVSRDSAGRAIRVNKLTGAYDRNKAGHDKATIGYGQEVESMFWEGHVSKGLSDKVESTTLDDGTVVSNKGYDYGVGGSLGTFLPDSNVRVRAGLDHEWADDVDTSEEKAKNTTLSAGIEKFFQDTPHSLGLNIAASKKSGGYATEDEDTNVTGKLSYRYDFGGSNIYQPDKRYRRVRIEIPGQVTPPRYAQRTQYKRVATYKSVPTYEKRTVSKPYKQLVKTTMELEGQTFFERNSAKLIPSAKERLKQIASEIRKNGYKGSIRITGNTCGLGDPVYDQRLSEKRANAVRRFLIDSGFDANRLAARGLGKGHPKYPNTPDQGFKNRRVDIEYVTESNSYQTAYKTEQHTVRTGTRQVATGFKNVPVGTKNVMIDSGKVGAPRVIWKTEVIPMAPAWIKRALHNNIRHNTSVNTYATLDSSTTEPTKIPPKAVADSRVESCGTSPMVIDVLSNDNDPDGDNGQMTVTRILSNPAHGEAFINTDGKTVTYIPDGTGCGLTDTFTYQITDETGEKAEANVSIELNDSAGAGNGSSDNTPPVASNDYATTACSAVSINVLENDYDPDGDTLSIVGLSNTSLGTATIEGNTIVYTPSIVCGQLEAGTDTFSYEISDGEGHTATANVSVDVTGKCNVGCTEANPDYTSTFEGDAVMIDVLDNDESQTGVTITSVDTPQNGTAVIVGDEIRYTPNAGFTGQDSFWYDVTDDNGYKVAAEVFVTIEAYDDSAD